MGLFSNQKQRVSALSDTAIFAGLPQKDLVAIQRLSDVTTLEDGTLMARQDRAPQQMFIIAEGTALVKRNGRKIAELGAGDTVGELSLLDGGKQTADVVAKGEVQTLVVGVQQFRALLDESPKLTQKMLKSLAMRLREADDHLAP